MNDDAQNETMNDLDAVTNFLFVTVFHSTHLSFLAHFGLRTTYLKAHFKRKIEFIERNIIEIIEWYALYVLLCSYEFVI